MTQSFQQLLVTNYGLQPSGYTGSQGVQGIAGTGGGPKISAVQVTDSSGTVLDDTAVDVAGGYILLTGSSFEPGCQVLINTTPAVSTTFVSATQVRAQVPATTAGTYIVYLVNADGGVAIRINGITFSAVPAWVTGSALSSDSDTVISIQFSADGALTYSLAAGSTLPPGLTLSSTGLLSGTVTGLELETVYNFTVNAIDAELQDSPRSFAITITAGDPQIAYVTALLSPEMEVLPFNRDASTNNFAVSVFGDTRPNNFGPYTPGYYSNFFDGTGDYLTVASNSAFAFSGSFTVEAWIYPTVLGADIVRFIVDFRSTINSDFAMGLYGDKLYIQTNTSLIGSGTVNLNTWNHIAYVRNGTTLTLYLNGISSGSVTTSYSQPSAPVTIGSAFNTAQAFAGYISNARIVNGTALYTANFTPPTQPLTAITDTSLLTCQSNRFIDNSTNNFAITRNGDVRIDGFDPFMIPTEFAGRGSAYFDGTGDYLSVSNSGTTFTLDVDFTIEAWVYGAFPTGSNGVTIIDTRSAPLTAADWSLGVYGNLSGQGAAVNNGLGFIYSGVVLGTNIAVIPNQWNHVAVSRSGTTLRMFVNGVQGFSGTGPGAIAKGANASAIIGMGADGATYGNTSYISNLRFVKGTAVYTANFTPPAAPLTAIANTSLLTCQTNQPHNNNQFLDSSTNNSLITRNGNATQGAFSPYGGGWSNYFDGTGDYLSAPSNSAFAFGTGSWTVEAWVYVTTLREILLFDTRSSASTAGIGCNIWSDGKLYYSGSANNLLTSTAITANSWNHVAWVYNGTTLTGYINGVSGGTATPSFNITQNNGIVGQVGFSAAGYMLGYISNLRVVKGTAVYTSNFTPPTAPLTPIAGTVLLTCARNRFVDDSPTNSAITRNGDVSVQKFNPFGIQTAMTPASHSAYFDSNTDTLSATLPAAIGTGDFTFEAWVYRTSASGDENVIVNGSSNTNGWGMAIDGQKLRARSGSTNFLFSTSNIPTGAWTHCAISRQGTTVRVFVNGVQEASGTSSFNSTATVLLVGNWTAGGTNFGFEGYISNARVIVGTAAYTAAFTPPAQPLEPIAGTSLLTCQSPTFVDNSTNRLAITVSGSPRPSLINPFGFTAGTKTSYTPAVYGGSMYFDGTGDYISNTSSNSLNFGTGAFTVEMWLYANTISTTQFQVAMTTNPQSNGGFQIYNRDINTSLVFGGINGSEHTIISNMIPRQWYHIAISRVSTGTNQTFVFVNGALTNTLTVSDNYNINGFNLGGYNASIFWHGYISNVRVVRGTAVYTSSFVPPAAPVTSITNTTLLVNGTAAAVRDASTGNNLETVGDARVSTSVVKYGTTSMAFDGTGDYLTLPPTQSTAFGTGNFTIEFWVYPGTKVGTFPGLFGNQNFVANSFVGYDRHGTYPNNFSIFCYNYSSTAAMLISTTTVLANTWYHVAITRSGSSIKLFVNGINEASVTFSGSVDGGVPLRYIGCDYVTNPFAGYIQDLRITRGVARYTATFTPPAGAFKTK